MTPEQMTVCGVSRVASLGVFGDGQCVLKLPLSSRQFLIQSSCSYPWGLKAWTPHELCSLQKRLLVRWSARCPTLLAHVVLCLARALCCLLSHYSLDWEAHLPSSPPPYAALAQPMPSHRDPQAWKSLRWKPTQQHDTC